MGVKKYNIGILAHVDAGKTSLTERLLHLSGALRQAGSVDSGTCATDSMRVERRRGISVRSACAKVQHNGNSLCFIDTPGHVDFAGEVERSLAVLDAAVVLLSAVEGVQAHTKLIFSALRKLKIPAVFVINKIDRTGSDCAKVISGISSSLGVNAFAVEEISGEGTQECSVSLCSFSGDEAENLILSLGDEALLERYSEGAVSEGEILDTAKEMSRCGEAFPVFFTSAKTGAGIAELLDNMCDFLPDSSYAECSALSGRVFKVEYDRDMGKAAYIRLFGGSLRNRESVNFADGTSEKIAQIRTFDGARTVDCGEISAGDTAVVYGLSSLKNGDCIGEDFRKIAPSLAVPLMTVTAHPEREEDSAVIMQTLRELGEEDPLLSFDFNRETREMYLNITGVIELEVLEELVFERSGARVLFSEPSVIFKETPKIKAKGFESYTMPKPCWAKVELEIEPLERGSGIIFESAIKDNIVPYRYQHHVEASVTRDCVQQGIYGWEVVDAKITLTGGEHHHVHTHPLDFFVATPVAFLRALTNCETVLLEPYINVTLCAQEELVGKVIGHIIDMRGEFSAPQIENGLFTLEAQLPVASSTDYPVTFRSLTSGKGTFSSTFCGYRECPKELYKTLPRRTPDPLDRAKWILYCRNCMTDSF